MTITKLRPDPRRPGHVVVYADGKRLGSLPGEAVAGLGLDVGPVPDAATAARLAELVDREGAYQAALRLLAARPRSSFELLQRLRRRGFNPSSGAAAVGRLEEAGLVDDVAFAQHFAQVRADKGHGLARILSDLLHRGVDRQVAERAALAVGGEEADQIAQVEALARKRARQLGRLPGDKKLRRIVGYLERRGHRGGDVVALVRRIVRETDA